MLRVNGNKNLKNVMGINIIKLYKKKYYKFLPKGSFFKSRFSQLTIFICNFNPLIIFDY